MSLFITALNSGSNGNCYYIGNQQEAILVDAGISCRETEKRMKRLGLDIGKVKAIFISHEHSDHITGLAGLSKKFRLPVYITASTRRDSRLPLIDELVFPFRAGQPISIGNLHITAFSKRHDAVDPHSFIVSDGKLRIGVLTDIGSCCKEVTTYFKQCHAVFLESNYCEDMLAKGNYPYYLKQRISSDKGHLSNRQALELFLVHRSQYLTHLVLSHLSKNNNDPALVERLFLEQAGATRVFVASRYQETPVFCIEEPTASQELKQPILHYSSKPAQLSLF